MPAGATFEPIATTTLTSNTNTVSFTGIPNTYTDLLILARCAYQGFGSGDMNIQFNSDTGNNYATTRLLNSGGSAISNTSVNRANINSGECGLAFTILEVHIFSYTASVFKNVFTSGINPASTDNGYWTAGSWRNTSAITSVQVRAEVSPTWQAGSTFTLYGITGA